MEKQKTKHNRNHWFDIGSVINGLLITGQCYKYEKDGKKKKAYKYKCLVCGYDCGEYYKNGVYYKEHMVKESNLAHGAGCAACSKNGLVIPSLNSIHVLRPDMEKFLKNKEDAMKYAPKSDQKLECVCPDCGKEYLRSCAKIADYGVPCVCGDGFSYPEKFIFDVLCQLRVNFKPQYYLPDSMFRYDFYLEDYNVILEVNGIQHYKQKWERDEVANDKKKKEFAFSCGFTDNNYVVLDCRESNLNYIKSSLINSRLNEIFDFNKVNFEKCSEFASGNMVKIACEWWNKGETVQHIANHLKLHKHTIISYLKQGNDNGWCTYKPGDGVKRYNQIRSNK